jgi:lipopolysaccharide assembly outer membrane protein LptD (OstA)
MPPPDSGPADSGASGRNGAERVGVAASKRSAPQDSAYHITAGSSMLREENGEKVLDLKGGVRIVHGDIVITSREGTQHAGKKIAYLVGDVKIRQNKLLMEGDEGVYRRIEDIALLKGNVHIHDRGWRITCKKAIMHRRTGELWLVGDVRAADSTTTLEADSLYYDRESMKAEVFGRVKITNSEEGFTVTGKHGFYFRERGEGVVDRDPHLIVDPGSDEPATVVSDTMRFYPDTRRATAYGRVKIIKGETVTQCDSAAVFDETKTAELYGHPLARQGKASMQGDEMVLHYSGSEVDRIRILGNALISEQQADSLVMGRENWIRGDSMTLYLSDNDLDSIAVKGNSTSEYYPVGTNKVERNYVRGDSMFFTFSDDTLSHVAIFGNAEGVYEYVNLREGQTCDSLRTVLDSSLTYIPFAKNAEKVSYSADKIEFLADKKDILLEDGARIYYQNRTLTGKEITYNSNLQLLDARGSPVLIEGTDKFYGSRMDYDLESGVGLVRDGSTKFQQGYYFGEDVAKVGDNQLKVWNSTYTTCDLKVPHYHFASKEMKVFLRDKVISGPIWLYIGNTPIAYLPFLANNISRGRKSGILRPEFEFGITKSTGRYIRNFGYYWATNDYTDFKFLADFNEDASLRMLIENRYKLRYRLSGNVQFSFYRDLRSFANEWMVTSRHQQTLGEKFSLQSDLRFVSSDKAPGAISRIDQVANVVERRIESRLSLRKSWNSVGFSASLRRIQQLNVEDPDVIRVSTSLPSISLSIPSRNLYFGKATKRGKKSFWEKFLGGIRYSPRVSMDRTTEERRYEYKETITQNSGLSFSSPRKIFFLNFSPSLSASNSYTRTMRKVTEHEEITNNFGSTDTTFVPSSKTITTDNLFRWSTGAALRTNFYGTFYPDIGPLAGIRHTITPSVTYSYNPRVGSRPSSQGFNVNLTNAVDIKVKKGEGTRKIPSIFIWSLGASYNPKAPERKGWSTVSSRVNLKLFGTSVSFNQTIEPYQGELLSTQVTSSLSLSGHHPFGVSGSEVLRELNVAARDTSGSTSVREESGPEREAEPKGDPWYVAMAFSYSKSKAGPARSTLNLNGSIQLTRNWKITYSTTYDVEGRKFMGQNYTVYRDLHCWEMSFARQKLGSEWQYYFRIDIKAHPEVYAESGRRGLGSGLGMPSFY